MSVTCHLCERPLIDPVIVATEARTGHLCTVACRSCSLVQTSPHPSEAEVSEYYASGDYRREFPPLPVEGLSEALEPTGATVEPTDREYEVALDRHAQHAARRLVGMGVVEVAMSRVVEVGCGDGRVASALQSLGVRVEVVEQDPTMRARAAARGLTVHASIGDVSGRADVALALQVVEHFADPVGGLVAIAGMADRVYVEVPTVERPYVSIAHFFQRAHAVTYSQHTLTAALKRAGFGSVHTAMDGSVLCAIGTREREAQPYEPHGGPSAEEVVGTLHAWERDRVAKAKAGSIVARFEACESLTAEERSFMADEWIRWRSMAVDAASSLASIVRQLEEAERPDWHPDAWVRGYYAGRIYEGQRAGIMLGHALNSLATNLNRSKA